MRIYLSVLFLFFIFSGFVYAQEEESEYIYNKLDIGKFRNDMKSVDSVKIAIFFVQNKETGMSPIGELKITEDGTVIVPPTPDVEDRFDLIADSKLTKKEISKLNKYLWNSSSFVEQLSLPSMEDTEIYYFSKGKVVYRILLAAYTRNFFLFDERTEERLIAMHMSKSFHHFIGNLLKKRKGEFWNPGMEFMFFENHPD